jgi:hypothetical protein
VVKAAGATTAAKKPITESQPTIAPAARSLIAPYHTGGAAAPQGAGARRG